MIPLEAPSALLLRLPASAEAFAATPALAPESRLLKAVTGLAPWHAWYLEPDGFATALACFCALDNVNQFTFPNTH